MPAAYAVVAGGCDWPLPSAAGLSNNDVIVLRSVRKLRALRWMETPLNSPLLKTDAERLRRLCSLQLAGRNTETARQR